jgi:hypothetical protein
MNDLYMIVYLWVANILLVILIGSVVIDLSTPV